MKVPAAPLTAAAFAPFGQVIEAAGNQSFPINQGTCARFHDLARLELDTASGRAGLSIFRARPVSLPFTVRMLERHSLSSQAFMPLTARRYLVVVAPGGKTPDPATVRAFLAGPGQGVNYARGVWHHPLLALDAEADFLVLDRIGPGANCDEHPFDGNDPITVIDGPLR